MAKDGEAGTQQYHDSIQGYEKIVYAIWENSNMELDLAEITKHTKLVNDLKFDSLDAVELILDLEKIYFISITDEEAGKFVSVGDVIEYISKI